MIPIKTILKVLPWLLVIVLGAFFYLNIKGNGSGTKTVITNNTILQKVEALGKLELVKYNFKEITQLNESLAEFAGVKFFESNIVLISQGEAVGCIDLMKIAPEDINVQGDTVMVTLPRPELCYYKLDMDNTKIFSLNTATFSDDRAFIQKAYRAAEEEIKQAAVSSGILEQARDNASLILKPLLREITDGKEVILQYRLEAEVNTLPIEK